MGQVVWPTALRNFWRNLLPEAQPCTVHDLRRTAATGMRRLKVDRDTVGLVLNHTAKGVTAQHYDRHEGAEEKCTALARWAEHLANLCQIAVSPLGELPVQKIFFRPI